MNYNLNPFISIVSPVYMAKLIVQFASFVFFCHEENKYMNLQRFYLRDIFSFIQKDLQKTAIVLFPGDLWNLKDNWDSATRIQKYESDFEKAKYFNFIKIKSVDFKELKEQSITYSKRLLLKNPTLKSLFKKLHFRFYLSDLDQACVFNGNTGMVESDLQEITRISSFHQRYSPTFLNLNGVPAHAMSMRAVKPQKKEMYIDLIYY